MRARGMDSGQKGRWHQMNKAGSHMISNLFGDGQKPQASEKKEKIWRVSEVLALARQQLEGRFARVAIVGEVSQFKAWRSGHWYFGLKDTKSTLNAVMFRGANQKVPFDVTDGLEVVAHGRLTIHPERSQVQIMVEKLEPLGAGALALAFEQLKKKLGAEGLFSPEHKKELPTFPQTVGLVTSPQGAALRDMLRVLQERWPGLRIILAPTRVQGKGAAVEIANAITHCDTHGDCDIMIVSRGGGSIEDLWAFNEEPVARAVFEASTPVVSAVGHATDTTIIDFVADQAVATPTHAASLLPEKQHWQSQVDQAQKVLTSSLRRQIADAHKQLIMLHKSMPKPKLLLLQQQQILDEAERRAYEKLKARISQYQQRLYQLESRLKAKHPLLVLKTHRFNLAKMKERLEARHPQTTIAQQHAWLSQQQSQLHHVITRQLHQAQTLFATQTAALDMLSPLAVLHRGYTLVQKEGSLAASSTSLQAGDDINIRFSDGVAQATVSKTTPIKEKK
ncbi:MAG: exodeoxyribonuclease VII large subunit [Myxococcales bacterium]|nr:exodeoxyribonuclease VII large subunit [Myxococcales bacterium]